MEKAVVEKVLIINGQLAFDWFVDKRYSHDIIELQLQVVIWIDDDVRQRISFVADIIWTTI